MKLHLGQKFRRRDKCYEPKHYGEACHSNPDQSSYQRECGYVSVDGNRGKGWRTEIVPWFACGKGDLWHHVACVIPISGMHDVIRKCN